MARTRFTPAPCSNGARRGVPPKWFRPPLGRVNVATLLAAAQCGYRTMNWSLDSNDWRCRTSDDAEKCAVAVLREVDRVLPLLLAEHALK